MTIEVSMVAMAVFAYVAVGAVCRVTFHRRFGTALMAAGALWGLQYVSAASFWIFPTVGVMANAGFCALVASAVMGSVLELRDSKLARIIRFGALLIPPTYRPTLERPSALKRRSAR
jgi:apolipoprotein N-acyltransferase